MMEHKIRVRRAYLPAQPEDGVRVLVDRLWPRGVSREALQAAAWRRGIAPSDAARKAFGHKPEKFAAFAAQYRAELEANPQAADFLTDCRAWLADADVTLLFAAKDVQHSNAAVLQAWLAQKLQVQAVPPANPDGSAAKDAGAPDCAG